MPNFAFKQRAATMSTCEEELKTLTNWAFKVNDISFNDIQSCIAEEKVWIRSCQIRLTMAFPFFIVRSSSLVTAKTIRGFNIFIIYGCIGDLIYCLCHYVGGSLPEKAVK